MKIDSVANFNYWAEFDIRSFSMGADRTQVYVLISKVYIPPRYLLFWKMSPINYSLNANILLQSYVANLVNV